MDTGCLLREQAPSTRMTDGDMQEPPGYQNNPVPPCPKAVKADSQGCRVQKLRSARKDITQRAICLDGWL